MVKGTQSSSLKRRVQLYLAMAAVSIFLPILVLEIALRLFLPHLSVELTRNHSVKYLPTVYARHRLAPVGKLVDVDPDKAKGKKDPDENSEKMFYISTRGYRGEQFDVRKPAGTIRVMIVGGSSVFDTSVTDTPDNLSNSWPSKVQKILHQDGISNVEVINAGIPGQSTLDSLGRLFSELWYFEPDYVLIYHGWNDIKFWSHKEVSPEHTMLEIMRPLNNEANPFIHYQGSFDRYASASQVYTRLRYLYHKWQINLGKEGAGNDNDDDPNAYGSTYSEYGPKQFKLGIELLVEASRSIGAQPILINQATLVDSENNEEAISGISYDLTMLSHRGMVNAYSDVYKIQQEVAAEKDVLYIDPAKTMNGQLDYFRDHVHLNDQGSLEIARIVAAELRPILEASDKH